jgi:prevent-host-death family protein
MHALAVARRKKARSRCATLTYMGSVGVRALQQHASEVVRRAAAGEVVEITDRGRPVARLVPTARTTLEGLVTAGLARPARSRLDEQPPPLPARRQGPSLSDLLAEARQAER